MKTNRKAAHLLAGSIMTAATIVGGAGIADAKLTAATSKYDRSEEVVFYYNKIAWTYTELDPQTSLDVESQRATDAFVKMEHDT